MARTGSPITFWKIISSISVAEIANEANRPVSVAVIGAPEARERAIQALFAADEPGEQPDLRKARALPESPFVQGFDAMTEEAQFPREPGIFDLVIDVGGGRKGAPEGTLIYAVAELGGWENTLERILEDRPDLALPLARNFPVFRRRVAQRIITSTATANAQFALLTGITAVFPPAAILLPINTLSDIVILTKNQTLMTLRLAAAYGLSVDYRNRLKELAPILGNAFGWRAIARELLGIIPLGVGVVAKATIAYAGTITVGKAAQLYYETGEKVSVSQMRRLYQEAVETSREKVRALADAVRGGGGRKHLPAGNGRQEIADDASLALEPAREPIETAGDRP